MCVRFAVVLKSHIWHRVIEPMACLSGKPQQITYGLSLAIERELSLLATWIWPASNYDLNDARCTHADDMMQT